MSEGGRRREGGRGSEWVGGWVLSILTTSAYMYVYQFLVIAVCMHLLNSQYIIHVG